MQEPLWDDQLKVSVLMWPLMVPVPLPGSLRKLPEARVCFSHCKEGSLQSLNGLLSIQPTNHQRNLLEMFFCLCQARSELLHTAETLPPLYWPSTWTPGPISSLGSGDEPLSFCSEGATLPCPQEAALEQEKHTGTRNLRVLTRNINCRRNTVLAGPQLTAARERRCTSEWRYPFKCET